MNNDEKEFTADQNNILLHKKTIKLMQAELVYKKKRRKYDDE